jgi:EF-P beta-lysylation protein EpmB
MNTNVTKAEKKSFHRPQEIVDSLDSDVSFSMLAHKSFPTRVPKEFLDKVNPLDKNDPLLLQFLPSEKELLIVEGFQEDAVGDLAAQKVPGLLHKYKSRALFLLTSSCAIHCRYCFRRNFPYDNRSFKKPYWEKAYAYIKSHLEIDEVLWSGGDPLQLDSKILSWHISQLQKSEHIHRLRIHSRIPIVSPQSITDDKLSALKSWKGEKVLVVHCNHPNELDRSTELAFKHLSGIGFTLLNQSVLLKGINDDEKILLDLSKKLFSQGVMPYYIHQLDKAKGVSHFEVEIDRGLKLIAFLEKELPGFLVPKYVQEIAGRSSKTSVKRMPTN